MRFGFTFIIILFQRTESFIRDLHKQKGIEHSAKQMKDSKDILTNKLLDEAKDSISQK